MIDQDEKRAPMSKGATLAIIKGDEHLIEPVENDGVVCNDNYVAFVEARQVMNQLRERAQKTLLQAEADAKLEREKGYQEGLATGRAEMFGVILSYRASMLTSVDARVEELLEMVASCAEQTISSLLPQEFFGGVVDQAVRLFADAERVEIYAHSSSIQVLESAFPASSGKAVHENIRFHKDNNLAEDEFRLVTEDLSISYSRPELLDLIRQAFFGGALCAQTDRNPEIAHE